MGAAAGVFATTWPWFNRLSTALYHTGVLAYLRSREAPSNIAGLE